VIPAEYRAKLAALREVFQHGTQYQDYVGNWWASLEINERRLVLAFAGLDDDEAAARRQWRQLTIDARDVILRECKHFARLVSPLKWA
jgi:hypothetical protein